MTESTLQKLLSSGGLGSGAGWQPPGWDVAEALQIVTADRLWAWATDSPPAAPRIDGPATVAVFGDFNNGKTTILNALLGTPLLPTAARETTPCPVELYSTSPGGPPTPNRSVGHARGGGLPDGPMELEAEVAVDEELSGCVPGVLRALGLLAVPEEQVEGPPPDERGPSRWLALLVKPVLEFLGFGHSPRGLPDPGSKVEGTGYPTPRTGDNAAQERSALTDGKSESERAEPHVFSIRGGQVTTRDREWLATATRSTFLRSDEPEPDGIVIELPGWSFPPPGVHLIDTAGLASASGPGHNGGVERIFAHADLVLFTSLARKPLPTTEISFLRKMRHHLNRVHLVLTKTDLLGGEEEEAEILDRLRQVGTEELGGVHLPMTWISRADAGDRSPPDGSGVGQAAELVVGLIDDLSSTRARQAAARRQDWLDQVEARLNAMRDALCAAIPDAAIRASALRAGKAETYVATVQKELARCEHGAPAHPVQHLSLPKLTSLSKPAVMEASTRLEAQVERGWIDWVSDVLDVLRKEREALESTISKGWERLWGRPIVLGLDGVYKGASCDLAQTLDQLVKAAISDPPEIHVPGGLMRLAGNRENHIRSQLELRLGEVSTGAEAAVTRAQSHLRVARARMLEHAVEVLRREAASVSSESEIRLEMESRLGEAYSLSRARLERQREAGGTDAGAV